MDSTTGWFRNGAFVMAMVLAGTTAAQWAAGSSAATGSFASVAPAQGEGACVVGSFVMASVRDPETGLTQVSLLDAADAFTPGLYSMMANGQATLTPLCELAGPTSDEEDAAEPVADDSVAGMGETETAPAAEPRPLVRLRRRDDRGTEPRNRSTPAPPVRNRPRPASARPANTRPNHGIARGLVERISAAAATR